MKYHHIALSVSDLVRSAKFYNEVLGFKEVKKIERADLGIKAIFLKLTSADDLMLELIQPDKPIKSNDDFSNLNILGLRHISFAVESVDREYIYLKGKNYEVTEPKNGKAGKYFL